MLVDAWLCAEHLVRFGCSGKKWFCYVFPCSFTDSFDVVRSVVAPQVAVRRVAVQPAAVTSVAGRCVAGQRRLLGVKIVISYV